ncbi:MAG: hypothetical protein LBH71_02580 [Oscillospiraceae bacterium]|jgi:hypothetical protein|nr:hypothetical protein [Oscillospiraceae bacterium]
MKNTREIAAEYRMSHWAEIMRQRVKSGLSITKYCEREGMHVNRYHYWQRRLRSAAVKEMTGKPELAQLPPVGWTQVSAAEESQKDEEVGVTIEIGKCRVRADETTDTEILTKVCKVLVELC